MNKAIMVTAESVYSLKVCLYSGKYEEEGCGEDMVRAQAKRRLADMNVFAESDAADAYDI